jgi:hypothetical protein
MTTLIVSKTNLVLHERVTFKASVAAEVSRPPGEVWVPVTRVEVRLTIYHYGLKNIRHNDCSATTTTGSITWRTSFSSVGTTRYYAEFAGNPQLQKSQSAGIDVTVVKIPATLSLFYKDVQYDGQGASYTVYGWLKDTNRTPIKQKDVLIETWSSEGLPLLRSSVLLKTDDTGYFTTHIGRLTPQHGGSVAPMQLQGTKAYFNVENPPIAVLHMPLYPDYTSAESNWVHPWQSGGGT